MTQPTVVASTPTATLKLDLPADATVLLMGKQMHKAGSTRQWSVPLTTADKDHAYEIQVVVGAKKVSHVATLRSGETTRLNVTLNDGNLVVRTSGAADQLAAK